MVRRFAGNAGEKPGKNPEKCRRQKRGFCVCVFVVLGLCSRFRFGISGKIPGSPEMPEMPEKIPAKSRQKARIRRNCRKCRIRRKGPGSMRGNFPHRSVWFSSFSCLNGPFPEGAQARSQAPACAASLFLRAVLTFNVTDSGGPCYCQHDSLGYNHVPTLTSSAAT